MVSKSNPPLSVYLSLPFLLPDRLRLSVLIATECLRKREEYDNNYYNYNIYISTNSRIQLSNKSAYYNNIMRIRNVGTRVCGGGGGGVHAQKSKK